MWHSKSGHPHDTKAVATKQAVHGKLWRLQAVHCFPLKGQGMRCMAATLDGRLAVGHSSSSPSPAASDQSGIELFTLDGPQGRVLDNESVIGISVFPNGRYVIRDSANKISLYYADWRKVENVQFDILEWESGSGGIDVNMNNKVYVVHQVIETIRVFNQNGGKQHSHILCRGVPISDLSIMDGNNILVTGDGPTVRVLENVNGDGVEKHEISEESASGYAAVLKSGDILVAWVAHRLLTIKLYTSQLADIGVVLADFDVDGTKPCRLREVATGEIAFCTQKQMHIFKKLYPGLQ